MSGPRLVVLVMLCASMATVLYMGVSGARWPLAFLGTMIAGSLIIGAGEAFIGRDSDEGD